MLNKNYLDIYIIDHNNGRVYCSGNKFADIQKVFEDHNLPSNYTVFSDFFGDNAIEKIVIDKGILYAKAGLITNIVDINKNED